MTEPPAGLTYEQALRALAERGRFGIRLGLGRTRALLRELDHPERTVRGALVAGTNGKGSVLALAEAALRAAGHRVGSTPKPHLVTYRERIQVDGRPIAADDFARLVGRVLAVADRVARRYGDPTEFELLTAVVFARFAEVRPDVALVEVGLGGRLDATHVWDGGVAVVTNVDLDHMDRLGDTVTKIAREKAAIIERGDLAVTGARGDGLAVIRRRARRMGVPLTEAPPAALLGWDRDGIEVDLPRLGPTRIGLRGRHQAANAAIADATLDALEAAGIASVPPDGPAARLRDRGLARPPRAAARRRPRRAPGRCPQPGRCRGPGHVPGRPAAVPSPGPITLVTASMADKDVDGVIPALAASEALADATVICTSLDVPRALPAADLAARWRALRPGPVARRGRSDRRARRGPASGRDRCWWPVRSILSGRCAAHLVDDPALRDPEPEDP